MPSLQIRTTHLFNCTNRTQLQVTDLWTAPVEVGSPAGWMEGDHQSTSRPGFRLDLGTPSAGLRRNGCWTPPPFFSGGVGPTTTTTPSYWETSKRTTHRGIREALCWREWCLVLRYSQLGFTNKIAGKFQPKVPWCLISIILSYHFYQSSLVFRWTSLSSRYNIVPASTEKGKLGPIQ